MITETIPSLVSNFYSYERGRNHKRFLVKLFTILISSNTNGYSPIITWLPYRRAFKINNEYRFEEEIMKRYFNQIIFNSFKYQLYLYEFEEVRKRYIDSGAYFHEFFLIS